MAVGLDCAKFRTSAPDLKSIVLYAALSRSTVWWAELTGREQTISADLRDFVLVQVQVGNYTLK